MHDRLFEAALGIATPWFVGAVRFDEPTKVLTVQIDFKVGARFGVEDAVGALAWLGCSERFPAVVVGRSSDPCRPRRRGGRYGRSRRRSSRHG